MTASEKAWAKKNGLKKTNLRTYTESYGRFIERIVYRANDGRLFYVEGGQYCGTYESYCHEA